MDDDDRPARLTFIARKPDARRDRMFAIAQGYGCATCADRGEIACSIAGWGPRLHGPNCQKCSGTGRVSCPDC